MEAIREAYEKREYTDVVVVCGDRTWDAHQVVVLKKSPYFKSNTKVWAYTPTSTSPVLT